MMLSDLTKMYVGTKSKVHAVNFSTGFWYAMRGGLSGGPGRMFREPHAYGFIHALRNPYRSTRIHDRASHGLPIVQNASQ